MTIKFKLTFLATAVILLIMAIIFGIISFAVRDKVWSDATEIAANKAYEASLRSEVYLETALYTSRTLASALEGMLKSNNADRKAVISMLQEINKSTPEIMAAWVCFEPNAFDGKDNRFINALGHDATGRFVPYVAK